jgi:flagellar assembly protein FliH
VNAVIKQGAPGAAPTRNPLATDVASHPAEPVISVEVLALRRQVEQLTQDLARREREAERLRAGVARAYRDGEADGRKRGREESDARRGEALAMLDRGVRSACEQFAAAMTQLDGLAAAVAREALAKLIGDPARHGELLSAAIHHQFAQIEAGSVVAVLVSGADFERTELAHLAASLAQRGVAFSCSDALDEGECQIRLRLGALDIGLPQQWERLDQTLRALAGEVG